MSMSHKAFLFDWRRFQRELAELLASCLECDDAVALIAFANDHLDELKDPYEGEALNEGWTEQMENGDIQEVADFVLTKFYDPTADMGLGDIWMPIDAESEVSVRTALLGEPFGPPTQPFDPGRMGAYFQSPETCQRSLASLCSHERDGFGDFIRLLEQAVRESKGIYVTF